MRGLWYNNFWILRSVVVYMKRQEDILKILTEQKQYLVQNFGVEEIALFGSYARGEENEESDIDILVQFKEGYKTFDN